MAKSYIQDKALEMAANVCLIFEDDSSISRVSQIKQFIEVAAAGEDFEDICWPTDPYRELSGEELVNHLLLTAEDIAFNLSGVLNDCQKGLTTKILSGDPVDLADMLDKSYGDDRQEESHEFAFDITLNAVARVTARTEKEARQALRAIDCLDLRDVKIPNTDACGGSGSVCLTEASLATDIDAPEIFEIDATEVIQYSAATEIGVCDFCGLPNTPVSHYSAAYIFNNADMKKLLSDEIKLDDVNDICGACVQDYSVE